jgi:protein-tyrosine phosphatase
MFRSVWNALARRWAAWAAKRRAATDTSIRLAALPVRRILVVCYGNIYRSPYLAEYIRQKLPGDRQIRSVGFHPRPGRPSPEAHIAMSEKSGVSLAPHRSAVIDPADLLWADTVILMDRFNWVRLMQMGVDENKLLWAGSLAGGEPEIADPYGKDQGFAQEVMGQLARAGDSIIRRVGSAD